MDFFLLENVDERVDNVLSLNIIPLLIELLENFNDHLLQVFYMHDSQVFVMKK
jgi:hypothetical protein